MARKKSPNADKNEKAYENALEIYIEAYWAYDDNKTNSTRRAWQESMAKLLNRYSSISGVKPSDLNPSRPFDWIPLNHLRSAMNAVIDGKDANLFYVTPSARYNSGMRFSKQLAVGHVAKGKSKADQQERKQWVMERYGISRSLLNEWIRTTNPYDYDEQSEWGVLHDMIDIYRENKLTGRRRKP